VGQVPDVPGLANRRSRHGRDYALGAFPVCSFTHDASSSR